MKTSGGERILDARIKLLLKKTRPLQLLFVVAAVVCLLVFLVFNFSLNDRAGAFEVRHADQQVEIPVTRDGLTDLSIDASSVRLEIGMVSSLTKPQVILAGEGYDGQLAKVDLEGTRCTVRLEGENSSDVQDLTMQVLLPQSDYTSITIAGTSLDLHVEELRTGTLITQVGSDGYAYFAGVKADSVQIFSHAPLRLYNNQIVSLVTVGGSGSVTFLENDIERVETQTESGGIFFYDTRVKGQWNLTSSSGDITMLSKNLPYNILVQASTMSGQLDIGYEGRYWDDAQVTDLASVGAVNSGRIVSVGNNPDKFIQAISDQGNISIGQRERYSDLDPYAADYPFADTNPYLIERSTITK